MHWVVQEITVNQQAKIRDCTLKTEGSKKEPGGRKQDLGRRLRRSGDTQKRQKRNKHAVCSALPRPCAQSVTEGSAAIHPVPLARTLL